MSRTQYILMTAMLALGVSARAWPAVSTAAGDTNFQVISENNIFDPNRGPVTPPIQLPPVVESIRLEGTMISDGAAHAFFGGTFVPAEGLVLGSRDTVADCRIQSIINGSITISLPDARVLVINVGDQIQRVGDGPWQLSQNRPTPEARPMQPRNNRVNRSLRTRMPQQESKN